MNYHVPLVGKNNKSEVPEFAERNGEIICPQKIYSKLEYPSLPYTMVKIVGQNGQKILIPAYKLKAMES